MSRLRLAAMSATIGCGLMLVGGTGIASAQTAPAQAAPLTQTIALTGASKDGKPFAGKYTIDRFVASGGKLYSVGTLTGKLGSKKVTKDNVRLPATVTGGATGAKAAQVLPPIPTACAILNLDLGPINLNLLGLVVRTNEINLRIDAVPGAGNLLGNLLCGITNILNPGSTSVSQLSAILNALLALLGG